MAVEVKDFKCPGCDSPLSELDKECKYCHRPIVIDRKAAESLTPQQIQKTVFVYQKAAQSQPDLAPLNSSLGHCYLSLKMYDKAAKAFEKAMEDDFSDSETFFYAAVCLLNGKKAFLQLRPTIDKIVEYVNAAIMIEDKGLYHYFLAYIKKDYFARKFYRVSPTWQEEYNSAVRLGCSQAEANHLFATIGIARPDDM